MRKHWAEWLLLGILAIGLVNLGMLLFRGRFVVEIDEAAGLIQRSSLSVPKARGYPANYQPMAAPDGVTGATPRIIAVRVENFIQRLRPAVVGIRGGGGGAAPLWTQAWGAARPAPAHWNVGSGVIVHPRGFIITHYHVVAAGPDIRVAVFAPEGLRDYEGHIVAADPAKDLALLKIEALAPLVSMPLGDSDLVRTGDQVLAIGNPFGLTQTVTKGIISARRRSLMVGSQPMSDLIQTDVPINPGNSGGPLCDLRGRLIGINVAIYSPVESVFTGVSLAIPVNEVKALYGNYMDFTQQPVDFVWPGAPRGSWPARIAAQPAALGGPADPGRVSPAARIMPSPGEGIEEIAWLGIDLVPEVDGVQIDEIEGISPMEAGLQAGDVLKSINGMPTPDMYAVKDAIKNVPLRTGQAVVLDVFRPRDNRGLFIAFRLKKWDIRGR
ncbi:MAG: trypsin-like peptidase domain-containing protein [Elusimicrobia bacterium]|nr:trypsin-like peptidase domain-containing protein [Elusimicrobiota bacterium]